MRNYSRNLISSLLLAAFIGGFSTGCGKSDPDSALHPLTPRYPDEIEATALYGALVVREGVHYYEPAGHKPWSAWHYQLNDKYFFTKTAGKSGKKFVSPLEKYDLYRRQFASPELRNPNSNAKKVEEELYEKQGYGTTDNWMGYCHATAAAAVDREPPTHSAASSCPVPFTIADLRALLVRTYDEVPGSRNFGGNFAWDRKTRNYISQADIYPDQLLKLIQVFLGEKRRSFYVDSDPGQQIWNEALIYANVTLKKDPERPHVMTGKMSLATAKTLHAPPGNSSSDDVYDWLDSTRSNPQVEPFTFELSGRPQPDGTFQVDFGEWTEGSRYYHPDFATVLPDDTSQRRSSNNPEIDPRVVDEILEKVRTGCR